MGDGGGVRRGVSSNRTSPIEGAPGTQPSTSVTCRATDSVSGPSGTPSRRLLWNPRRRDVGGWGEAGGSSGGVPGSARSGGEVTVEKSPGNSSWEILDAALGTKIESQENGYIHRRTQPDRGSPTVEGLSLDRQGSPSGLGVLAPTWTSLPPSCPSPPSRPFLLASLVARPFP